MNSPKSLLYVLIGFLIGIMVSLAFLKPKEVIVYKQSPAPQSMSHTMDSMNHALKGKTGDSFDKAFITEMIVHHDGAIEMAELALTSSNREELKDLANAIIEAQSSEITQMKQWLKDWNLEEEEN